MQVYRDREIDIPFPEAVTAVKLARLVGGSCSVAVGLAETPAAKRPRAKEVDFILTVKSRG